MSNDLYPLAGDFSIGVMIGLTVSGLGRRFALALVVGGKLNTEKEWGSYPTTASQDPATPGTWAKSVISVLPDTYSGSNVPEWQSPSQG